MPTLFSGGDSALTAPEVSPADEPRTNSNPLFCADRQRHRGGPSATAGPDNEFFVEGSGGESGGNAIDVVFCASKPSTGGSVAHLSSETGGGSAVQARYTPFVAKNM